MSLLHTNNKDAIREDTDYWVGMLVHLAQLLRSSTVEDGVTNEARVVILARISALAFAMQCHFGEAVEKSGLSANRGVLESGIRTHDVANKYMKRLEEKAQKALS